MPSDLTSRLGGARSSLAFKAPVRCATTANITLSGFQTIDGITPASGDTNLRILVKDQTNAVTNGIYEMSSGAWSRAKDFDGSDDLVKGTRVYVANGTTNGDTGWVVTTADPITIGTSSIAFDTPSDDVSSAVAAAAASASAAATSASAASTSASSASTSASNASTSATNAATSATSASSSATSASSSASAAAASAAAIASVTYTWNYDTSTTMADPGTGEFRLNTSSIITVSAIAFSDLSADSGNPDVAAYVQSWDNASNVYPRGYVLARAGATWIEWIITGAVTDNSGWTQVPVAINDTSGSLPSAGTAFTFEFSRAGFTRFANTGLKVEDTDASHVLTIVPGSNLSANRTLTVTTGDSDRTVTISGNATISQDYSSTGSPTFANPVVTSIEVGHASDTTLARSSAGIISIEGETVHTNSTSRTLTAGSIELGAASDTTLARSSAGNVTIEGNLIYRAGGTAVPVTDGGTGASSASAARTNLGLDYADEVIGTVRNIGGAVGDGSTDDRAAFATANTAGDIVIPRGTYRIASSITISNSALFLPGAKLSIDSGAVVTFSKPIRAGLEQIISGSGTVSFTRGQTVYPQWWGAVSGTATAQNSYIEAAEAALPNGGVIHVTAGQWYLSHTSPVRITTTGVSLRGDGAYATTFFPTGAGTTSIIELAAQDTDNGGFALNADNWYVTSSTSLAIGTGSKTFTVLAGYNFVAGDVIRAQSAANDANYMQGSVTSYSGTSLVVNVTSTGGSGTLADWRIGNVNTALKTDYDSGLSTGFGRSHLSKCKVTGFWRAIHIAYASGGTCYQNEILTARDAGILVGAGGSGVFASQIDIEGNKITALVGSGVVCDYNTASVYFRKQEIAGGTYSTKHISSIAAASIDGTNYKVPENIWHRGYNADFAYIAAHYIQAGHLIKFESCTASGCQAGPGVKIDDAEQSDALGNRLVDGIRFDSGCEIFGNALHGIHFAAGANLVVDNCDVFGNSVAGADTYDGIYVEGSSNPTVGMLVITNNRMPRDTVYLNSTTAQRYAVNLVSGAMADGGAYNQGVIIAGNMMRGYATAINDAIEASTLSYASGLKFVANNAGVVTETVSPQQTFIYGPNLKGSTSGTISLVHQAVAGTYNWNWPTTAGSSGEYLISGGGSTTAMTWGGPHRAYGGYIAGRYYFGDVVANAAGSTVVVAANQLHFIPFIVGGPSAVTWTKLGVNVTSSAAGNARLGIYRWASGAPTTLVLDAGTVSTGSTGEKEITISQSLSPGFYALAIVFDATPTITAANPSGSGASMLGQSTLGTADTQLYHSHTYGALPASASAITYNSASPGYSLWMRV